jgi:hypothetical protein
MNKDANGNEGPFQGIETLILAGPPPPLDAEFKRKDFAPVFARNGLGSGRCFGSKSGYRNSHPQSVFIPNANVFSRKHGKIWWGDLDLHQDKAALERIAHQLRTRLYVLSEFDGRFEKAERPHAEVVNAAVWHTGGLVHVHGRREFLKRSGLSPAEAAFLLRLSRRRFHRRQKPKVALEIGRRMRSLEDTFIPIVSREGHRKWGFWWTRPNAKLGGRCPIRLLRSGETLDFAVLTEPTVGIFFFAMKYSLTTRL